MKRFDFDTFIQIINGIRAAQTASDHFRDRGLNPQVDCGPIIDLCAKAVSFGAYSGFRHVRGKAASLADRMKMNPILFDSSAVGAELRSLEGDIASDMMECIFIQVSGDVRPFFENAQSLGANVLEAFPACKEDIVNAGNCIAVGLGTAAVFHLMRVAEFGLRAFARNLGLRQVVVDKKNRKTTPLEFSQWEKILNQLPARIEEKVAKIKAGPKRQDAQEFYYSSLNEIKSFKDAWRNHVMHVRQTYTLEDAAAVMSHVSRFMSGLALHGITLIRGK